MPTRDYYVVLGIPHTESVGAIRAAFRDRAKRLHPDRSGGDAEAFRELREAYEVLTDRNRRRRYDGAVAPADWAAELLAPEPMVDEVSIFGDAASVRPSFDELHARFERNFTGLGVPKAERAEPLDFELILTPEEARRGGLLPFGLPCVEPCPRCGGSGEDWSFYCRACSGTGIVERRRVLTVRLPARMRSDTILEAPLSGYGIDNLYLRLRVRIAV